MFKALVILFTFVGMAISQVVDQEFILENMEMLEALELLDSDVEIDQVNVEDELIEETEEEKTHES